MGSHRLPDLESTRAALCSWCLLRCMKLSQHQPRVRRFRVSGSWVLFSGFLVWFIFFCLCEKVCLCVYIYICICIYVHTWTGGLPDYVFWACFSGSKATALFSSSPNTKAHSFVLAPLPHVLRQHATLPCYGSTESYPRDVLILLKHNYTDYQSLPCEIPKARSPKLRHMFPRSRATPDDPMSN